MISRQKPQNTLNGESQPNGSPANAPLTMVVPCSSEPSTTPWQKVASIEPPMKARSQRFWVRRALARNSKAAPRKIRPITISTSGR